LRESIHAGTPMLLLPQFADQRPNAERVAACGLGLMLDPTTATEGDVRNACEELLADAAYGAAVEALRLEMAYLPPLATLVDELAQPRALEISAR
jgi:UDP:flavonoid glycosyltransferase YjiC (YdhE family)